MAKCVEPGCESEAGTPWTPLWCLKHDEERRARITKQLDGILAQFGTATTEQGEDR